MRLRDWWWLAALTLLALGLRLWRLDTLPPGFWYDEAHKAWGALQILRGESAPIYVTDIQGIEAGYFWLLAGWFKLWGPSYWGSRLLTATLGALNVPLLFFAVRTLYRQHPARQRLAWLSAVWLSFLLWHLHWSRVGFELILVPLASVAVLGLTVWACDRAQPWAYALAGVMVGLSQYTNPAARVLPLLAGLVWWGWGRGSWRQRLGDGLWLGLGAVLTYAPLGWFFWQNPEWFSKRLSVASEQAVAGGAGFYMENVGRVLWGLVGQGDSFVRHNLAGRPALDFCATLVLAVGLGRLVADRPHWRAHGLLLGALGLTLLPSVLSDGAPLFSRMLGAAPFLMVLLALGLSTLLAQRPGRFAVALSLLLGSASLNLYDYFGRYPQQPGLFDAFENGLWQLTQSAATGAEAGPSYLVVSEAELYHPTTKLTQALTTGPLRVVNAQTCWVTTAWAEHPTQWAVLAPWRDRLAQDYATYTDHWILHEPEPFPYATVFTLPAGFRQPNLPAPLGTLGDWAAVQTFEVAPAPVAPGASVPLTITWLAFGASAVPYTVFVHLIAPTQPYITGVDSQPCQSWYPTTHWQAGELIADRLTLTLPTDLPVGDYQLVLGLYDLATLARLPVAQTPPFEPDRLHGGTLTVR